MKAARILILLALAAAAFPALGRAQTAYQAALRDISGPSLSGKSGAMAKVGFDLALVYEEQRAYQTQSHAAPFAASNSQLHVRDGGVVVEVVPDGAPEALRPALEALGMSVEGVSAHMISGTLPISAIADLAALEGVRFASPAYYTTNVGLTTSQGDAAMNSDNARTYFAVNGAGQRVGVLSDSYNALGGAGADVASGDLPGPGNPDGFVTPVNVLVESGSTDEGRGMLQIVHDVAPGATLAFATANGGQPAFATNINNLRLVAGCTVIVDDFLYFAEPMYQDGVVAQAVNASNAAGVPYFSSAANQDRHAFEDTYRAGTFFAAGAFPSAGGAPSFFGGTAHDFDPGAGVDVMQAFTLGPGQSITLSFQWDQPFFSVSGAPGSANDLDIYVLDSAGATILGGGVASNAGGDPVEVFSFTNTAAVTTAFNLMIVKFSGPSPTRIKYVNFGSGTFTEWATNTGTLYGHANALGAEAVGAARYTQTPRFGVSPAVLETFSSAGATPILFTITGAPTFDARTDKPGIVAPDGANTTFFGAGDPLGTGPFEADGFPNFFGTSAAAPHAAAVAALMRQFSPALPPASIYLAMESTAQDMGVPGFDNDSGWGLINAVSALANINHSDNLDVVTPFGGWDASVVPRNDATATLASCLDQPDAGRQHGRHVFQFHGDRIGSRAFSRVADRRAARSAEHRRDGRWDAGISQWLLCFESGADHGAGWAAHVHERRGQHQPGDRDQRRRQSVRSPVGLESAADRVPEPGGSRRAARYRNNRASEWGWILVHAQSRLRLGDQHRRRHDERRLRSLSLRRLLRERRRLLELAAHLGLRREFHRFRRRALQRHARDRLSRSGASSIRPAAETRSSRTPRMPGCETEAATSTGSASRWSRTGWRMCTSSYIAPGSTVYITLVRTAGTSDMSFDVFSGVAGGIYAPYDGVISDPMGPGIDTKVYTSTDPVASDGWHPIVVYRPTGTGANTPVTYDLHISTVGLAGGGSGSGRGRILVPGRGAEPGARIVRVPVRAAGQRSRSPRAVRSERTRRADAGGRGIPGGAEVGFVEPAWREWSARGAGHLPGADHSGGTDQQHPRRGARLAELNAQAATWIRPGGRLCLCSRERLELQVAARDSPIDA